MGFLVDGKWVVEEKTIGRVVGGKFDREPTLFRNKITRDGSSGYPPDPSRYHLYIALICPWAHRTLITLRLKNLQDKIGISIVDPVISNEDGWKFTDYPESTPDHVNGFSFLREVYLKSDPNCSGRVTVPVLFDKIEQKIVNNESSEIIVMLNECFDGPDFYPIELREKIEEVNQWVYHKINNGVYRAGFATSQEAYDEAVVDVFDGLERVERILNESRYLAGDVFTLADVRLFTTLVRFDVAYFGAFKCNLKRILDYKNIWNYLKEIYQMPEVMETVNFDHIKRGYYSIAHINPNRVIAKGPLVDFMEPHDRDHRFPKIGI